MSEDTDPHRRLATELAGPLETSTVGIPIMRAPSPEMTPDIKRKLAAIRASAGPLLGVLNDGAWTELAAAVADVPPGAVSSDAPAWLIRLHSAACDVVGKESIAQGDVVYLCSGGPAMTVEFIAGGQALCAWGDDTTTEYAKFSVVALTKVRP